MQARVAEVKQPQSLCSFMSEASRRRAGSFGEGQVSPLQNLVGPCLKSRLFIIVEHATERWPRSSRPSPSEPGRVFGRVDGRGGGGRAVEGDPEGSTQAGLGAPEQRAVEEPDTELETIRNTMVVILFFRGRG